MRNRESFYWYICVSLFITIFIIVLFIIVTQQRMEQINCAIKICHVKYGTAFSFFPLSSVTWTANIFAIVTYIYRTSEKGRLIIHVYYINMLTFYCIFVQLKIIQRTTIFISTWAQQSHKHTNNQTYTQKWQCSYKVTMQCNQY